MTQQPRQIDCHDVLDVLYEYLDGELTAERVEEVKAHLANCAPCMALTTFEQAFVRFLEVRMQARTAPDALKKRILDEMLFKPDES